MRDAQNEKMNVEKEQITAVLSDTNITNNNEEGQTVEEINPEELVHSSGVALFRDIAGEPHFLLLRCYHYWDFPKGRVEEGETYKETAHRELGEETRIKDVEFLSDECYTTEPYSSPSKVAHYFLAKTEKEKVVFSNDTKMGKPEHDDYQWVPYRKAVFMVNPRIKKALDWAYATWQKSMY